MIIIEFNGLPGCGKSSVALELEKILKEKNYNVIKINNEKSDLFKRIKESLYILKLDNFNYLIKIMAEYIKYRNKKKYNSPFSKTFELKMIRRQVVLFEIYKKSIKDREKMSIAICDQGVIQDFQALIRYYTVSNKSIDVILKEYLNYKDNITFVNCNTDLSIAYERMKGRNRHTCEFDEMTEGDLKNIYLLDEQGLDRIKKRFKNYDFNMIDIDMFENNPKENAEEIYEFLFTERR